MAGMIGVDLAPLVDPRAVAAELVTAVHDGNELTVMRVLRGLDGENLRSIVRYLASCVDPDHALVPVRRQVVDVDEVLERTLYRACDLFGVSVDEARSQRKKPKIVNARHVAYAAAVDLGYSQAAVGRAAGRDHTTVRHACLRVEDSELLGLAKARVIDVVSEEVYG